VDTHLSAAVALTRLDDVWVGRSPLGGVRELTRKLAEGGGASSAVKVLASTEREGRSEGGKGKGEEEEGCVQRGGLAKGGERARLHAPAVLLVVVVVVWNQRASGKALFWISLLSLRRMP